MGIQLFSRMPRIYEIERKSAGMNKDVFDLILKTENNLAQLKEFLDENKVAYKESKLAELENNFLLLKSKIEAMREEMDQIIRIEMQNKEYLTINDSDYLNDKNARLEQISNALEELIELMNERPAVSELKGMINYIYEKINLIVESVNNIVNDDKYLEQAYSRIQYL